MKSTKLQRTRGTATQALGVVRASRDLGISPGQTAKGGATDLGSVLRARGVRGKATAYGQQARRRASFAVHLPRKLLDLVEEYL